MGMGSSGIHHVAIVVDDLEDAMALYGDLLGLTWTAPWTGTIPFVMDGQTRLPDVRFALSTQLARPGAHRVRRPRVRARVRGVGCRRDAVSTSRS